MKHLKLPNRFILFGILLIAAAFRFNNLYWDQGYHLHPDERAIVMSVEKIALPDSFGQFLSVDSPLNPHFFAYGSFPFYLLKVSGLLAGVLFSPLFAHYGSINLIGRCISALADLFTLLLVFKIASRLFSLRTGFIAAFLYAISVLPIQLSHFYAVDTLLTLFITATLYQILLFYDNPTVKRALLIGLFFGLAISTKASAAVLLITIVFTVLGKYTMHIFYPPHAEHHWKDFVLTSGVRVLQILAIIIATGAITFAVCEPYALIDFAEFSSQTAQQSIMTKDPYVFPYTLQYAHKIPYVYEAKNIFLYGFGPLLGFLAFAGLIYTFYRVITAKQQTHLAKELIFLTFFIFYVGVVGKFAVGFMRYMLPIYPLLIVYAAVFIKWLVTFFPMSARLRYSISAYIIIMLLIWPVSFAHIYTQNNPRVTATDWINTFIPPGKILAIEHWDDSLPMLGQDKYIQETLALYDPDNTMKWETIQKQLTRSDYILIASNRLYTPLQKLTDCSRVPEGRCYPQAAKYYKELFAGKLGFTKVAEFTNYPTIPFFNIPINDLDADESFTVYDHPKIMIFQKTAQPDLSGIIHPDKQ
jgi:4-amino-4-deoxy-L-arabinose transferase-like glycosyltransferase